MNLLRTVLQHHHIGHPLPLTLTDKSSLITLITPRGETRKHAIVNHWSLIWFKQAGLTWIDRCSHPEQGGLSVQPRLRICSCNWGLLRLPKRWIQGTRFDKSMVCKGTAWNPLQASRMQLVLLRLFQQCLGVGWSLDTKLYHIYTVIYTHAHLFQILFPFSTLAGGYRRCCLFQMPVTQIHFGNGFKFKWRLQVRGEFVNCAAENEVLHVSGNNKL